MDDPAILTAAFASPLGELLLAQAEEDLIGLWLPGQKYHPALTDRGDDTPLLRAAAGWLEAYFAGERPDPRALPLAPRGSDFARRVWQALLNIPYGETTTYGALARQLSCRSAQAVGGAVGRNPLSIIIPCHRVLGAGGSLTGYAGGLEKKHWLLAHEQRGS